MKVDKREQQLLLETNNENEEIKLKMLEFMLKNKDKNWNKEETIKRFIQSNKSKL